MKITILIGDPLSILLYATYTTIFYNILQYSTVFYSILQYTLHYSLTTLLYLHWNSNIA
jgi:hypothetical protein